MAKQRSAVSRPSDPWLTAQDVADQLGINVRVLWRAVARLRFPSPTYVTARTPRWRQSWIDEAAERNRMAPAEAHAARLEEKIARQRGADRPTA
ncbi:MAG TPA: hypothetical protein VIJ55_03710 [Acetobacteraceae bacterium]